MAKPREPRSEDPESALPYATPGPSLLDNDAGPPAQTIVDLTPDVHGGVEKTRLDEIVGNEAAVESAFAELDAAAPTAVSAAPFVASNGAIGDPEALEESGPTENKPMVFGRAIDIDAAGMKAVPSTAHVLPMARAGLRVKESVRGAKPPPLVVVGSPVQAPVAPALQKPKVPQRAIPTAVVRERPRPVETSTLGVDPAVYPVTFQPSRAPKQYLLAAVAFVILVIAVFFIVSANDDPVARGKAAAERRARASFGQPSSTEPSGGSIDPRTGAPLIVVKQRFVPKPAGRPPRGPIPVAKLVDLSRRPTEPDPSAPDARRTYDTAESPPIAAPNLYVFSDPAGAWIEVDGQVWGQAPFSQPVDPEWASLKVRAFKDGYLEQKATLQPTEKGHFEWSPKLLPDVALTRQRAAAPPSKKKETPLH